MPPVEPGRLIGYSTGYRLRDLSRPCFGHLPAVVLGAARWHVVWRRIGLLRSGQWRLGLGKPVRNPELPILSSTYFALCVSQEAVDIDQDPTSTSLASEPSGLESSTAYAASTASEACKQATLCKSNVSSQIKAAMLRATPQAQLADLCACVFWALPMLIATPPRMDSPETQVISFILFRHVRKSKCSRVPRAGVERKS